MILRASASGSSDIRRSLSQIIVLLVSGSVAVHFRPGILGSPVAAKEAQEAAIFYASTCASGVFPGSLFATLRIIEAELEVGCVPRARQSIENRALPSKVVSEGRRCVKLMLQFGHLYHIVAHAEAVQSRAAVTHV
jgi:hypothetical protein